jgi:flagellar basal body rod protein FlgG
MIDPATARALADVAARAGDLLASYSPGFEPHDADVRDPVARATYANSPLSVAAPPDAYFIAADRGGRRAFTRDGTFSFVHGTLTATNGDPILGYRPGVDPTHALPEPLRADPVDIALGRCTDLRLESDGTLAYTRQVIDPRTSERRAERASLGRIALARFPAGSAPTPIDANRLRPPLGVEPHLGMPADGNFTALATYSRDRGRLDLDRALVRLQEAYLALDALHAAQLSRDGIDKTALDLVK